MATQPGKAVTSQTLQDEIKRLEGLLQEKTDRLQETQDTLDAIRSGAVDGLVRSTAEGDQVFLLKGSDEPYRILIEQMNEGALLISETGTILFCNRGFARLVDAPLEGVMGSNIQEWVNPNNTFNVEIFSSNIKADQRLFDVTFKTTRQQPVPTQLSVNKISLDSINASALIVTDLTKHMEADVKRYTANLEQEVTARKNAEEDARKSEQQFLALVKAGSSNSNVIYRMNADWTEMRTLQGQNFLADTTEPSKTWLTKYIPDEDKEIVTKTINKAIETKRIFEFEHHVFQADGSVGWTYSRAIPLLDKAGKVVEWLGVATNITERKKAEEDLREAKSKLQEHAKNLESLVEERTKKLQDAQRLAAIGQVAGMVGHDIRNPLQAIVGELYFAKETMNELPQGGPKEALESLEFIQQQTDYISKIVSDLQDYAKPLKPEFVKVELCEFVDNAVKAIVIPDNIQTAFNCAKDIPQITLDKTFTTRVLTNLVNNAVQAMPKGGKLTINAQMQNNSVAITVEDTGVGIPEDVKPKMFTPLFTTKSKGQGFGLPVVKRLVEAQGGIISFESETGKGTKFIVTLPLAR
jgi:PAS domain S-box-containing protein